MYMLSQPIEEEYSTAEEWFYILLVNELLRDEKVSSVDEWLVSKRQNAKTVNLKAEKIVSKTTSEVATKLKNVLDIVEEDTLQGVTDDLKRIQPNHTLVKPPEYKFRQPTQKVLVEHTKAQTVKRVEIAVDRLNGSMLNQLENTYLNQVDNVYKELSSSNSTVEKAVQKSMKPVAQSGIKGFTDKGGKQWQSDVYMRNVMRNSIKMYHNHERLNAFIEQGYNYVVVSEHPGSRPTHYGYQNKVYSLIHGDKYPFIGETGIGEPAGLLGVNCRHFLMPFVDGMTVEENKYTAEENEQMYAYLEQQRYYERSIKQYERERILADKTGDTLTAQKYQNKIKATRKELNSTIKQANDEYGNFLRRQKDRESAF
jgi:hypothetical protein